MEIQDIIDTRKPHDMMRAEEWNTLIKWAKRGLQTYSPYGAAGSGYYATRDSSPDGSYLFAYSEEDVPAFSVFGISGEPQSDLIAGEPLVSVIKILGANASAINVNPWAAFSLFTNGEVEIAAAGQGTIHPLSGYKMHRLEVTGTTPVAGMPCGVKPGTWGVGTENYGMMCLALDDSGSTDYAWCIWRPPHMLLGKTDAPISKGDTFDCPLWAGSPGAAVDTGLTAPVTTYLGDLPDMAWLTIGWNGYELVVQSVECITGS